MTPPRIVGIMMAKDEADAIPEVLPSLIAALDVLYYSAGDDDTAKAIDAHSPPGWARSVTTPNVPRTDGIRHYLLEAARADKRSDKDYRAMWVLPVQGDEIYHDEIRPLIFAAHAEGAQVMATQVATFLLHESQREGWDWTQPLSTRLTHYIRDFGEHMGFLDDTHISYNPTDHMRAHPHGLPVGRGYATKRPIRKHYPFRSPEQARKRLEDRIKSGWQPHYKNYTDVFMSGIAAGRTIYKFNGDWTEAERRSNDW